MRSLGYRRQSLHSRYSQIPQLLIACYCLPVGLKLSSVGVFFCRASVSEVLPPPLAEAGHNKQTQQGANFEREGLFILYDTRRFRGRGPSLSDYIPHAGQQQKAPSPFVC